MCRSQCAPDSCEKQVRLCIVREVPLSTILAFGELTRTGPESDHNRNAENEVLEVTVPGLLGFGWVRRLIHQLQNVN